MKEEMEVAIMGTVADDGVGKGVEFFMIENSSAAVISGI
jgi:hypothetical protein